MKREVQRERTLPAFKIELSDLEALWGRLVALFESEENVYGSIEVTLPAETLEFENIEELKQYPNLSGKITDFSIWISKSGRRVSLRSKRILGSRPVVRTTAESEAWCAGAVETVHSFLQQYKRGYNWFIAAPIGWVLLLMANVPAVVMLALPEGAVGVTAFAGWLVAFLALALLYFSRERLFPGAVLVITEKENFIRRNSAELGLAVAVLSAVLTVIGWLLNA